MSDQAVADTGQPTPSVKVTFEEGYRRLQEIVRKLDRDDITVHETCELFREGKALEAALRAYLDQREGELREIEEGRGLPVIEIVPPAPAKEPPLTDDDLDFTDPQRGDDPIPF